MGPFDTEEENVHFRNVLRALQAKPDAKRAELAQMLGTAWTDDVLRSWMSNPKVVNDPRFATTDDGKARPSLKWLKQFLQQAPVEAPVAAPVPQVQQAPAIPGPGQTETIPVPSTPQAVPAPTAPAPGPTAEQIAAAKALLEGAGQQVVPQGQYAAPAPTAPAKASPQDVAYAMRAAEGLRAIGQTLIDCGYADPDWKRVKGWMETEPSRIETWVAKQGYDVEEYKRRAST
jgi:hypothetical protein